MASKVTHVAKSIDADRELKHHLEKAEEHLIEAVALFGKRKKPDRMPIYVERLTRAQETVTALLREELVRIRGPLKVRSVVIKKKGRS